MLFLQGVVTNKCEKIKQYRNVFFVSGCWYLCTKQPLVLSLVCTVDNLRGNWLGISNGITSTLEYFLGYLPFLQAVQISKCVKVRTTAKLFFDVKSFSCLQVG